MSGAAPAPWRAALRLVAAVVVVLAAASATARCATSHVTTPQLPETLRGAQIRPADLLSTGAASALAGQGVNVVLIDRGAARQGDLQQVDGLAKRVGLRPVTFSSRRGRSVGPCGPTYSTVVWSCAQFVPSLPAAVRLARRGGLAI